MDIVERLRDMQGKKYRPDWSEWVQKQCSEAATEIERLRAVLAASCDEERSQIWEAGPGGGCSRALDAEREVARLRAALDKIAEHNSSDWPERCQRNVQMAREALTPNDIGCADPKGSERTAS